MNIKASNLLCRTILKAAFIIGCAILWSANGNGYVRDLKLLLKEEVK